MHRHHCCAASDGVQPLKYHHRHHCHHYRRYHHQINGEGQVLTGHSGGDVAAGTVSTDLTGWSPPVFNWWKVLCTWYIVLTTREPVFNFIMLKDRYNIWVFNHLP